MTRPVRISRAIDVGKTLMVFAAEDADGPLEVRIGLVAWEELRMAPPYLDDEDRRDAALFELELLSAPDRVRTIDGKRVVDILIEDIDVVVARFRASLQTVPIPWDKTVEFFQSGETLSVVRAHFTLRDAVTHFLTLPPAEQDYCGIGIHETIVTHIKGIPAALGFLRPHAIRRLAADPSYRPNDDG